MKVNLPTLLFVEDDPRLLELLSEYFLQLGYRVLTAERGEDAVKKAWMQRPGLILLDVRLPDISGFEVAQRLKSQCVTARIPIIFLTDQRSRDFRLHGLGLAAEDYITKPFDLDELRLRVQNTLARVDVSGRVHPVTGLPQGPAVNERLTEYLGQTGEWLALILLTGLDRLRENLGFVAHNELVQVTANAIENSLVELRSPDSFIGHLADGCFILVTNAAKVVESQGRLERRLQRSVNDYLRQQGLPVLGSGKPAPGIKLIVIPPGRRSFMDLLHLKQELQDMYCQEMN
jgi:CheY-like chemotaxis protein